MSLGGGSCVVRGWVALVLALAHCYYLHLLLCTLHWQWLLLFVVVLVVVVVLVALVALVVLVVLEVMVIWVWDMHRSDTGSNFLFSRPGHAERIVVRVRVRLVVRVHFVVAPLAHSNLPRDHDIHGHAAHIAVAVADGVDVDVVLALAHDSSCPYRKYIQHSSTSALCSSRDTLVVI